ncbi:hypothetical protein GCM10020255_088620 [Rhodococcus baikonurensis]
MRTPAGDARAGIVAMSARRLKAVSDSTMDDILTVGIDVGGTSIRASVVDVDGQVLEMIQAPTPQSARALEDGLDRVVRELVTRHEVSAVGLAVAGFITSDRSSVRFAPHLPWVDAPVGSDLSKRLGLPVVLEHDANAAAFAEHRFGAAAGGRNVVMVAIGTGIGGALLINGELYRESRRRPRTGPHPSRSGRASVRVWQTWVLGALLQRNGARRHGHRTARRRPRRVDRSGA